MSIENDIPSLLALGKITKFVEFKGCETEFFSFKVLNLKDCDYDLRSAPPAKFIDTLGTLINQNNMELIIVKVSSGVSFLFVFDNIIKEEIIYMQQHKKAK